MFNLYTLPFISIIAAFITLIIVITFARKIDGSLRVETIILTGIVFSSFLSALISLMIRSEEHTSELQSRGHLVCRLLLENKKINICLISFISKLLLV